MIIYFDYIIPNFFKCKDTFVFNLVTLSSKNILAFRTWGLYNLFITGINDSFLLLGNPKYNPIAIAKITILNKNKYLIKIIY